MSVKVILLSCAAACAVALAASPAGAVTAFHFSTGAPDGKLGALSQPANDSHGQTETADDFILPGTTRLTSASFTGLLTGGANLSDVRNVEIEIYHVFPNDSAPPSGVVTTRANSPSDVEIAGATRDGGAGSLSFSTQLDSQQFTVGNTVTTGIRGAPSFTGGDGPAAGEEATFNVHFTDPILLAGDHFFFRPEVELDNGSFLWLSSQFPVGAGGTPFTPDRQAWIRNDALAPDWVRIGTDVTHTGPFNMSFALNGVGGVPEPTSWALMISGCGLAGAVLRRQRRALASGLAR
jgi:hypothetical protein